MWINILEFALLRLQRTWKKQISLLLLYSLVVVIYASVVFFTGAMRYETENVLQGLPSLWVQKITGGRLVPIADSLLRPIAAIRGVKNVKQRYWGYIFDDATGAVFTVMGTNEDLSTLAIIDIKKRVSLDSASVVCGTGYLEMRGLEIGDFIALSDAGGKKMSFKIVGAFSSASDVLTRDLIVMSVASAQTILGLSPHFSTDLAVEIHNENEISTISRKISEKFAPIRVVTLAELKATYETLFSWRGGIFVYGAMLSIFAFLLLVWQRASALDSDDKKEIVILKGVGWQLTDVLRLRMIEASILSILATCLGILGAYMHVFVWEAPLLKPFLAGWSVLYPHFNLMPILQFSDIVSIFFLSIVPYLAATLIPAWKVAITSPEDSMRL